MKKYYLKPNMEIVEVKASQYLLSASVSLNVFDSNVVISGKDAFASGLDMSNFDLDGFSF